MKRILLLFFYLITIDLLFAQNQFWENIEGPYGGLILSLIVDENVVYCAGNGGVYKSTDNGDSWVSLGLKDKFIREICIASGYIFSISNSGCYRMNLSDTAWINIKEGRWQSIFAKDSIIFIGSEYAGIFRSTDSGFTWVEVNNGINNLDIEEIFITSNNIVLASAAGTSGSGFFRSTNNGDSWERIDPYPYAWNFEGIAERNSVLYAFGFSNNAKVYKSTDFGKTWFLPVNASAPSDIIQSIYVDETSIYVGVDHYGIFKSTNEGASWVKINSGLNNKYIFDINGNSSNIFLATYDGVYKSSKSNLSWVKKSDGINNIWVSSLFSNNNKIFIGTYGSGLFTYENGTFNRISLGEDLMFIIDMKCFNNQIYLLSSSWAPSTYANFQYSFNNGKSWVSQNNGFDTDGLKCIGVNDKYIYVGSSFGLFRKQINGYSWEKLVNGIPYNVNISSIASSDSVVIATNGMAEIFRSTDYGNSWQTIFVQDLDAGKKKVYSKNKGEFYLGSGQVNKLFISTDYGNSWKKVNLPLFNSTIQSIYADGNDIFIGLSNDGILTSSDRGINWISSNIGLDTKTIADFSTFNNTNYVGTNNNGIYKRILDLTKPVLNDTLIYCNEITLKWTSSTGINKYRVQVSEDSLFEKILLDNKNIFDTSYTLTFLDYKKVYYWRVSSVTKHWDDHFTFIKKIEVGNPSNFHIYQNYPNPFNNQTTIRFEVPKLSLVKLELFDILGRKVKTLLSEQKAPGSHKFILANDFNLTSGVYILKFSSENFSKSIKILLLK